MTPDQSEILTPDKIMDSSPEALLQLVQSITADMANESAANESSSSQSTSAPTEASTILDTIQQAVDQLTDEIIAAVGEQQTALDAANEALRSCGRLKSGDTKDSAESSEPKSVDGWHARHSNC